MIELKLKDSWNNLLSKYTESEVLVDAFWEEIVNKYIQKNRHYHNLNHIHDLLKQAEQFEKEIVEYDILQFSIWYHDIIYRATKKDNELKSAELAKERLSRLTFEKEGVAKCYQQILATKTHRTESDDKDTKYLLDFDLSILGRPWEQYLAYTKKIRKEYWIYPNFLYKKGRKKVLEHFLNFDRIFKTDHYYSNYEEQARANLRRELDFLSQ